MPRGCTQRTNLPAAVVIPRRVAKYIRAEREMIAAARQRRTRSAAACTPRSAVSSREPAERRCPSPERPYTAFRGSCVELHPLSAAVQAMARWLSVVGLLLLVLALPAVRCDDSAETEADGWCAGPGGPRMSAGGGAACRAALRALSV